MTIPLQCTRYRAINEITKSTRLNNIINTARCSAAYVSRRKKKKREREKKVGRKNSFSLGSCVTIHVYSSTHRERDDKSAFLRVRVMHIKWLHRVYMYCTDTPSGWYIRNFFFFYVSRYKANLEYGGLYFFTRERFSCNYRICIDKFNTQCTWVFRDFRIWKMLKKCIYTYSTMWSISLISPLQYRYKSYIQWEYVNYHCQNYKKIIFISHNILNVIFIYACKIYARITFVHILAAVCVVIFEGHCRTSARQLDYNPTNM